MKKAEIKFKDLRVGDYIYVTTNIEVFKLKIDIIEVTPGDSIFHFENDDEFMRLNAREYLSVIAYNLDGFELDCGDYSYWADRNKCLDYLNLCVENAKKNVAKLEKSCGYKWVLTTEHIFEGLQVHSVNEYADKDCCYNNMREVALSVLQHFKNKELIENKFAKIEFKRNAIWIDLGDDIRFTYNIVKC